LLKYTSTWHLPCRLCIADHKQSALFPISVGRHLASRPLLLLSAITDRKPRLQRRRDSHLTQSRNRACDRAALSLINRLSVKWHESSETASLCQTSEIHQVVTCDTFFVVIISPRHAQCAFSRHSHGNGSTGLTAGRCVHRQAYSSRRPRTHSVANMPRLIKCSLADLIIQLAFVMSCAQELRWLCAKPYSSCLILSTASDTSRYRWLLMLAISHAIDGITRPSQSARRHRPVDHWWSTWTS